MEGCPICDKHRGEGLLAGEVLYEDEKVLHIHVAARHPDTPQESWGPRVDERPDALRGGEAEITALYDRLRAILKIKPLSVQR